MKQAPAVLMPFLLALAGCLSPPIPQELVDVDPPAAPEPLLPEQVARLYQAGISEEVIVGLIRSRGTADRANVAPVQPPRIVYRELFIPLWPSYAGGRWHVGLRIGCYYGTVVEEEPAKAAPAHPRPPVPQPDFIDP